MLSVALFMLMSCNSSSQGNEMYEGWGLKKNGESSSAEMIEEGAEKGGLGQTRQEINKNLGCRWTAGSITCRIIKDSPFTSRGNM